MRKLISCELLLFWNPRFCPCWTILVSQYEKASPLLYSWATFISTLHNAKSHLSKCSVVVLQLQLCSAQISVCLDFHWITGSDVCIMLLCASCWLFCVISSQDGKRNKSSNFFTWILLTLREMQCTRTKPFTNGELCSPVLLKQWCAY